MHQVALSVTETTSASAGDDLRELRSWLVGEDEFRGRVTEHQSPPPPGAMGPVLDALTVALGPGGALTALTGAVIVWLRNRRGKVVVKVTSGENTIELDADRVRGLDPAAVQTLIAEAVTQLDRPR
jgi:Effector Associated Constant Component 1